MQGRFGTGSWVKRVVAIHGNYQPNRSCYGYKVSGQEPLHEKASWQEVLDEKASWREVICDEAFLETCLFSRFKGS